MRRPAEKPGVPELAREQKVQRFCREKSWGGRYVLEDARGCRVPGAQPHWKLSLQLPPPPPRSGPLEWSAKLGGGDNPPRDFPTPCFPRVLKMEDFFPETYRLDIRDEREAFFTLFDGEKSLDSRPTLGRPVQDWTKMGV